MGASRAFRSNKLPGGTDDHFGVPMRPDKGSTMSMLANRQDYMRAPANSNSLENTRVMFSRCLGAKQHAQRRAARCRSKLRARQEGGAIQKPPL